MNSTEHFPPPSGPIAPRPSEIIWNRSVAPGWYVLRLREESIARRSRPGQFVQVLCSEDESCDPLLRRPFSVYRVDREAGTYDILYTVVGRGTRFMASLPNDRTPARRSPRALDRDAGNEVDDTSLLIDVLGPLGGSFTAPDPDAHVHLVGGGVGLAPLYFLAEELIREADRRQTPRPRITCSLGARTAALLAGIEDFRALPIRTEVATDDGSEGFRGRVTELFESLVDGEDPASLRVYGCGPQPMNESLRKIVVARGLAAEICLESIMACGFGICFGCVAPIRRHPDGPFENRRICWEGPVFDARFLAEGIEHAH